MEKQKLHIVSLSGGKDSTAMLLRMLEEGMPVDIILFCDTGLEIEGRYHHIDKLEKYIGRSITRLKSDYDFEYLLLEHMPKRKNPELFGRKGYSWAGPRNRWCIITPHGNRSGWIYLIYNWLVRVFQIHKDISALFIVVQAFPTVVTEKLLIHPWGLYRDCNCNRFRSQLISLNTSTANEREISAPLFFRNFSHKEWMRIIYVQL